MGVVFNFKKKTGQPIIRRNRKTSMSPVWWSVIATVVLFAAFGLFITKIIQSNPARPIFVDADNLTVNEAVSLQNKLADSGRLNFFGGDLSEIYQKTLSLSWVEYVSVHRDWHKGVIVEAVPRKAIANYGSEHLLDANGQVYSPADKNDLMNPNLVTLYGAKQDAEVIMKQLSYVNETYKPLGLVVESILLTPRKTWVIRFSNGIRLIVDYEDTQSKLYHAAQALEKQYANKLSDITSVDLRYKNGIAIAWRVSA